MNLQDELTDMETLRITLKVQTRKILEREISSRNRKGQLPIIFIDNIDKAFNNWNEHSG